VTHRTARVGELIRQELSTIIAKDYTFGGMFVTIHHAEVAPDLKNCTVFVGVIGGKEELHASVIERLNRAAGALQRPLYRRVTLKSSPRLFFKLDRSAERGVRIVNAMETLPEAIPESDEPLGVFRGRDGLDHRWEKADDTADAQPFGTRKPGQSFSNTASDTDSEAAEADDEDEDEMEDSEEDDDERK